jgi:hypothetical protein
LPVASTPGRLDVLGAFTRTPLLKVGRVLNTHAPTMVSAWFSKSFR